jgi:carboxymethylenebutenolidase
VIEKDIEIKMADGVCDAVLYEAGDGRPVPGVIDYPDIFGVRPSSRGMSRRLAEKGYTVLLPNPFYRTSRSPVFTFKPDFGDERTMKRFGELTAPLTPEAMESDGSAFVDFLAGQKTVSGAKMGAIGHCFTGVEALRTAAARPDRIGAIASFHGGRLIVDGPASPHLVLPRVKAHLYFGHAKEDKSMPKEAIEKLDAALAAWGGKYESVTYDALHGWTVPDSHAYDEPQAERAFEKLTALFAATLK